MIDFYNAFISYKHAPLDSKVAEHVQRNLERFHIPHAIRKKTGRKKIERIFRDKDELPITSDLTDTISNALEKAEYLIVICSPRTKESIWVQREIKFFLRNHRRDKILTVLVEGEPQDVIPDILKYDEHTEIDFTGEEKIVKTPIEPLSCDYRMPLNKAKKEELPRLAAALIGCSYDELVRRQRAYTMRRIIALSTILTVASIAFGLYMFHSKRQINENLQAALINESKFLASESGLLLGQERRLDALYLALAALPSEENPDRPVTSEAVQALTNAVMAYRGLSGVTIEPLWNYSPGNTIDSFVVNPSGTELAALDSVGKVTVWDTENHNVLCEISNPNEEIDHLKFINDTTLVMADSSVVYAYDTQTGDRIWFYLLSDHYLSSGDFMVTDYNSVIVFFGDGAAVEIDGSNGQVLHEYDINAEAGNYGTINKVALSPDGQRVGFAWYYSVDASYLGILDIATGDVTVSHECDFYVSHMEWADNDHIIASFFDMQGQYEAARINDYYYMTPTETNLVCFNARDISVCWESEHVSASFNSTSGFLPLEPQNLIGFYSGDVFSAYDIDDGTMMYEWHAGDTIVDASDRDNNGFPVLITRGGGLVTPIVSTGINDMTGMSFQFAEGLTQARVNHGVYVLQEHTEDIIYYNTYVHDEAWEQADDVSITYVYDFYLGDDVLAILCGNDSYEGELFLIDPNDNSLINTVSLAQGTFVSDLKILGVDGNTLYVMGADFNGVYLYKVNINTGRVTDEKLSDAHSMVGSSGALYDGYVTYLATEGLDQLVGLYNTATGRSSEFELPLELADTYMDPAYSDEFGIIYVSSNDGEFIIDTQTGDYTMLLMPDNWYGSSRIYFDDVNRQIFVSDGADIVAMNTDGEIQMSINLNGKVPIGFTIVRYDGYDIDEHGVLLVACADGSLYRYDAATGEFIGETVISSYSNYNPEVEFSFDYDAGYLYVQQYQLTNVINLNSWSEEAIIEQSFGHHVGTDRFFTYSWEDEDDIHVGFFRHYTLEELIKRAQEMIGDNVMSDEFRSRYGL